MCVNGLARSLTQCERSVNVNSLPYASILHHVMKSEYGANCVLRHNVHKKLNTGWFPRLGSCAHTHLACVGASGKEVCVKGSLYMPAPCPQSSCVSSDPEQ